MQKNLTDAVVVHCIDFRLQEYLNRWLDEKIGEGNYDRVAFAGGVLDFETIFGQIKIAENLHEIKKVILINHEDCGAYGAEGSVERHHQDLQVAAGKIKAEYPSLEIEGYYLHLNGLFEKV